MKKLIARLVQLILAIVVGMSLGFAVAYANPECYQTERGVVSFHPTVFFVAMTIAGVLICKFKRIRNSVGLVVALALTSFPFGIIAPAVYYSSFQFIGVGIMFLMAAYTFSRTSADIEWSSTRIAIKATR